MSFFDDNENRLIYNRTKGKIMDSDEVPYSHKDELPRRKQHMTQQFDNTNKGVLFQNDRKETDRHPDWKGKVNIQGVDHWISGWAATTQRGDIIRLAIGEPCDPKQHRQTPAPTARHSARPSQSRTAPAPAPAPSRQPSSFDDMDDDCPF